MWKEKYVAACRGKLRSGRGDERVMEDVGRGRIRQGARSLHTSGMKLPRDTLRREPTPVDIAVSMCKSRGARPCLTYVHLRTAGHEDIIFTFIH